MVKGIAIIFLLVSIFILSISMVSASFPAVSYTTYDAMDTDQISSLWNTDWTWSQFSGRYKTSDADTSGGYIEQKANTSYIVDGFKFSFNLYDTDYPPYSFVCLGEGASASGVLDDGVCVRFPKINYYESASGIDVVEYESGSGTEIATNIGSDNWDNDQEIQMYISSGTLYMTGDKDGGGFVYDTSVSVDYVPNTNTVASYSINGTSDEDISIFYFYHVTSLPPENANITSTTATNINQFNVTLEGDWTFEDATWIDAYWKIDTVAQSHTNSTSATSLDQTFTSLDFETEYDYQLCLDTDIGTTCSLTKQFNTSDRVAPSINIAGEFDITQTQASIGGTFLFGDFTNITSYAVLNGVNQTQTLYESGTSQYDKEDFTGLTYNTNYTWDWCISYEDGEICDGGGRFTTLDYTPPSINIINAFDITNHEATLGTTVLYNDYENMTLAWYLDDVLVVAESFTQVDEFDTSEYYTYNLTLLDYFTQYDYELRVTYTSHDFTLQNVTSCDDPMTQTYDCKIVTYEATNKVALFSGSTVDASQCLNMAENWRTYISNTVAFDINHPTGVFDVSCIEVDNGYCSVWNTYKWIDDGDGSSFASNCTTTEISTGTTTTINDTDYFRTLDAYIPYHTISGVTDISGTTATLTQTFYKEDYDSLVPYFVIDGVDQTNKTNISSVSEPYTYTLDLTELATNTTYNYTACVGYGLGWSLLVCNTTKEFTTGFSPSVTFGTPTLVNANDVTLHWTVDWAGTTNVTYKFKGSNPSWVTTYDGVAQTWKWDSLTAETNYTYWLEINYTTLGTAYLYTTPTQYVTTYYENAFDDVWDTLLQGSGTAKTLLGFVVLFGIIFVGVGVFGKYNMRMGLMPIILFVVVGTAIATLMKLFSVGMLLLVIVGAVVLAMLTGLFKNHDEGGR